MAHRSPVRTLWHCLEHVHAITYFDEGCRTANRDAGLRGFWMGYFASRAAPLGPVGPGVVEALFFNFAPTMVKKALPDAWGFSDPSTIVNSRRRAAAHALIRIAPDISDMATRAVPGLEACVKAAPGSGRPMFCANRDLAPTDDPTESLWQLATTLREHRGDAHVSVLASRGLTGCDPHVLIAAERDVPPEVVRDNRGWSEDDWLKAANRLEQSGLLTDITGSPKLTGAGQNLRDEIEQLTDELAMAAYEAVGDSGIEELIALLDAPARAISRSGIIPYPNPIGLPPLT